MTVRPKDSYNYRLFWRVSWREVAEALGYKTAHTAMRAAQRYAQKQSLPWPIRGSVTEDGLQVCYSS